MRGLLQDDFELVKAARDTIVSEIMTGMQEGTARLELSSARTAATIRKLRIGFSDGDEFLFRPVCGNRFCPEQGTTGNFEFFPSERLSLDCLERVYVLDRQLFHSGQIHKAFSLALPQMP